MAGIAGQADAIENTEEAKASYAFGLRMTVAVSVGATLVVGVFEFQLAGRFIILLLVVTFWWLLSPYFESRAL